MVYFSWLVTIMLSISYSFCKANNKRPLTANKKVLPLQASSKFLFAKVLGAYSNTLREYSRWACLNLKIKAPWKKESNHCHRTPSFIFSCKHKGPKGPNVCFLFTSKFEWSVTSMFSICQAFKVLWNLLSPVSVHYCFEIDSANESPV